MEVTYSDPVKNADINKSKAALVEIIDDLRKRFARKNDEWSEAEALAAKRKELLRRAGVALEVLQDHHCSGMEEGHMEVMELINSVTREIAEELGDDCSKTETG